MFFLIKKKKHFKYVFFALTNVCTFIISVGILVILKWTSHILFFYESEYRRLFGILRKTKL